MQITYNPYFLVKILKSDQVNRKDKDGELYVHPDYVYMARGMQCAEIVQAGKKAREIFPDVKPGHIVLMHHFVEGKSNEGADDGKYFVFDTDTHNYYMVTVCSHRGRQNETYGVYDGDKIVSHPDYFFLNEISSDYSLSIDDSFEIKYVHESRHEKGARMKEMQNHIKELTKTTLNDELKREIEKKEGMMNHISREVNRRFYNSYLVMHENKTYAEYFGLACVVSAIAYVLNIACNTRIEFNGTEYIVAKSKYVAAIEK